ncbi:hypothetical protein B0H11DRAFT_1903863 [Mycena galericulata]|nr:hypothetical protein B0H11DRAFT_1903863 [Mycena galericulata]
MTIHQNEGATWLEESKKVKMRGPRRAVERRAASSTYQRARTKEKRGKGETYGLGVDQEVGLWYSTVENPSEELAWTWRYPTPRFADPGERAPSYPPHDMPARKAVIGASRPLTDGKQSWIRNKHEIKKIKKALTRPRVETTGLAGTCGATTKMSQASSQEAVTVWRMTGFWQIFPELPRVLFPRVTACLRVKNLREFSRLSDNSDDEGEPEISGSSRSSTPDSDDIEPSALFIASRPPAHPIASPVPDEPLTITVDQAESADDSIPQAANPAPLTNQDSNTLSGLPKPRRVAKRPADSTESAANDPDLPLASAADSQRSEHNGLKTRSGRATKKSKKLIVVSDDEDEESKVCTAPNCTVYDDSPMVACSGPACTFQAHLCCVGIKVDDRPTQWFCDDDCRENAGGRARKRRKLKGD